MSLPTGLAQQARHHGGMPDVVALHLGALHPVEQGLTLLLAFGPFVALGLVVWLRQRDR